MRFATVAVLALLLASTWVPSVPAQAPGGPENAAWWHPSGQDVGVEHFRDGWNLRIPLVIEESRTYRAGTPVQAHMDLAETLILGGWPDRSDVPLSFMATQDSVRLIEYTDQWELIPGQGAGVPFTMFSEWLTRDQSAHHYGKVEVGTFHGQRSPVLTLEWRLTRDLLPSQPHHYFLYFDLEQNAGDAPKPAPVFHSDQVESLDGLYWIGAGTTLFGYNPEHTLKHTVRIIGTGGQTGATLSTYNGGRWTPEATFTLGQAHDSVAHSLGLTSGTHFRVDADRPVILMTHRGEDGPGGFVPSHEGGLVGWNFTNPTGTGAFIIIPPGSGATNCGTEPSCYRLSSQIEANGGPIMVQLAPQSHTKPEVHLAQAASLHGSPVGQAFHAATISTMGQGCRDPAFRPSWGGYWVSAAPDQSSATVQIERGGFPVFSGAKADPSIRLSSSQAMPERDGGCGTATHAHTTNATPDQNGHATGPIQLRVGGGGSQNNAGEWAEVSQSNPFGGRHGMSFRIQGPFVVYNYYESTHIQAKSAGQTTDQDMGAIGTPIEFQNDVTTETILTADKPVSVFPFGRPENYARFHAALPEFLTPDILQGQFRGYIFDIDPDSDPVFVTALPGAEEDITFAVQNLARWAGQPLEDTLRFSAKVSSPNWDDSTTVGALFQHDKMRLNHHNVQTNRLTLHLPPEIPTDTQLNVRVQATSDGNPDMTVDFAVVVLIRQTFGVEMWFGAPSSSTGLSTLPLNLEPGQSAAVPFVVRNTGSGVDSFDLNLAPPGSGWQASVTDVHGAPLQRLEDVAPGRDGQVGAILHVRAPLTEQAPSATIPVSAVSTTSPLASHRIQLSAALALDRDFVMEADALSQTIGPGQTQRFQVLLRNTGEDALSITLSLDHDMPAGWSVAFAGLGSPSSEPISLQPAQGNAPGQEQIIPIDITAPLDAQADDFVSFLVRAEDVFNGVVEAHASLSMSAVVARVHDLDIATVPELVARPGETTTLKITIDNLGNTPDAVMLEAAAMPGGWSLTGLEGQLLLAPGQQSDLDLGIVIPAGYPPEVVDLKLQARSGGPAFAFQVPVRVEPVHEIAWEPYAPITVQPGDQGTALLRLQNLGNIREDITLNPSGIWPLDVQPSSFEIPVGATRTVRVEWVVPQDQLEGDVDLAIMARADSGPSPTLGLLAKVEAPRLELAELLETSRPTGRGSVGSYLVILHNPGNVPVRGAEVRIVSLEGDAVLDKVRFEAIGPNGTVVAPLRWSQQEEARPTQVLWGQWVGNEFHALGAADLDEATDAQTVHDRDAPFPAAVLLMVLAIALLRRRGGDP